MKKPTRITEEPRKLTGKAGRHTLIKCDDGKEYTIKCLAEVIGISSPSLQERLKAHGWRHPNILTSTRHTRFFRPKRSDQDDIGGEHGDCAHLSGRGRGRLLDNIPGPTVYERKYCGDRE